METPKSVVDEEVELKDLPTFIPLVPNPPWESQAIRDALKIKDSSENTFPWPEINSIPINEYNTKGLLSMDFQSCSPLVQKCPYNREPYRLTYMNMHCT